MTEHGSGTLTMSRVDVRDPQAVADWITDAVSETGGADVVVNNAGGVAWTSRQARRAGDF